MTKNNSRLMENKDVTDECFRDVEKLLNKYSEADIRYVLNYLCFCEHLAGPFGKVPE